MKQRLVGTAALLAIGALVAGVPWLFVSVGTRARVRFDLATADGWWQAVTVRDDGTLLTWLILVLGAITWVVLVGAILLELISRARHVAAPRLPGLGVPQTIAHALVAAAMGAALSSNLVAAPGTVPAVAAPRVLPAEDTNPAQGWTAPQARPEGGHDKPRQADSYVVKKGDTLWEIADDKLGDPYAYPQIFKASRHTIQADGRRLTNPDLIYPGWRLTLPDDKPADKPAKPPPAGDPRSDVETDQPTAEVPSAAPTFSATPGASASAATATAHVEGPGPSASDHTHAAEEDQPEVAPLPWMLAGLGGAGALLSGGLCLWLRRRRAAQFRFRRPGRTITVPAEPALAVVEKTLMHQGDLTSELAHRVAQTNQRLAARLQERGMPIPTLRGIDVTFDELTYHFAEAVELTAPWEPGDGASEWTIRTDLEPNLIGPWDEEREPVWPTLVTLGRDDQGWRMINLETYGVITLTGNRVRAEDLLRCWAAELSVSHWARDVEIAGGETVEGLRPLLRHRYSEQEVEEAIGRLVEHATQHIHWLGVAQLASIDAARAEQAGPELWKPHVLLTSVTGHSVDPLIDLMTSHPGHTGISVVLLGGGEAQSGGTEIRLTDTGRVHVPTLGLDLVATGITADEAAGCAALMDAAEDSTTDAPMPDPPEPAAEWQSHCDAAGHLHTDLVIPRGTTLAALHATSLLPEPDPIYVKQTANTAEDLAEIAPLVPASTTAIVNDADPTLDRDLAEWRAEASERPRLSVLGPVRLRLGRGGQPTAGIKRVAYYTEIAAYLATRPHGATADELITALGVTVERARIDLHTLRTRLGINPTTDRYFVPKADDNAENRVRNEGVYLIEDLLCDAELFRRLRVRGEAAGAAGIDDLAHALRLVTGTPYEQLRRRGGLWLADSRDDQHLIVAVVDVAHLLTTHALATGDIRRARAAAELAHAVAPSEVTPQVDLAAIAEHEGLPAKADQISRDALDWLDGTGEGPMDIGERADTILRAHRWLDRKGRAS